MTSFPVTARIILAVCFMALLTLASITPDRAKSGDTEFTRLVAKTPTLLQKVLHVCLYGALVLLLAWTLDSIQSRTLRFSLSFVIAVAFGAVMEWCQTKVPGRFGTVVDVALNTVGAALGLVAAVFLLY